MIFEKYADAYSHNILGKIYKNVSGDIGKNRLREKISLES